MADTMDPMRADRSDIRSVVQMVGKTGDMTAASWDAEWVDLMADLSAVPWATRTDVGSAAPSAVRMASM
jgi:hypothetical protein